MEGGREKAEVEWHFCGKGGKRMEEEVDELKTKLKGFVDCH